MKEPQKEKSVKRIIEKYRFIELDNMEKSQLISKFHELFRECKTLALERDIAVEMNNADSRNKGEGNEKKTDIKYLKYNSEWGGIEKVIYILMENSHVMTTKEIEHELLTIEPGLRYSWDKSLNAVGRYIYRALKCHLAVKYKLGNKFVYGLREWFDANNCLKNVYVKVV